MDLDYKNFILFWHDGDVSTGIGNLEQALAAQQYGHSDGAFNLFYTVNGVPVKVESKVKFDGWDDSDYGTYTYTLSVPGHTDYEFTMRIDGRA